MIDYLYLALASLDDFGCVPYIYKVFGEELLIKFLDIFSGQTIEVPTADRLREVVRDVTIFRQLSSCTPESRKKKVVSLSEEYELDPRTITAINDRMSSLLGSCSRVLS